MDPTPILKCLLGPVQNFLGQAYDYVVSCKPNNDLLQKDMEELKIKKKSIKDMIKDARRDGKDPTGEVKWWLHKVKELEREANEIDAKIQKKITCVGDLTLDVFSAYQLSKRAQEKLEDAKKLRDQTFIEIAKESGPDNIMERFEGDIIGMDSEFRQLQDYVRDDTVRIIGVYGMGGVGKTALLEKLGGFLQTDVENVIWVDMSRRPGVEDIQKAVGGQLGVQANNIFKYLKNTNFLLILDNLWEPVDLKKIGIPTTKLKSKSKIILTTRIENICDQMDARKVEVKCLECEDAWNLFEKKAGKELSSNPKINHIARKLAEKCGGLPLALITIGRAMASKRDPAQWKIALTSLSVKPWQIQGMEDKVFSGLKDSYDNLANNKLRTCFLYCSLYPEKFSIYKEWIIDYCIGEGIINDLDVEDIYNRGHDILGDIKASSLLEGGGGDDHIQMHPMIRAMALWIACDCGKKENRWLVQAGAKLQEAPEVERWREAERISLMRNNIKRLSETPECPSLLTLMLQRNYNLRKICDGFFQYMPFLKVLDLSHTFIQELPSGIEALVELQYLDLCGTVIRTLPKELGALTKLRFLLLSFTPNLNIIPNGVIANLSKLQVFYIHASYGDWKVGSIGDGIDLKELNSLRKLNVLGITVGTIFALIKLASSYQLAKSTRNLHIRDCPGLTTISTAGLCSDHKALQWLQISDSSELEEVYCNGIEQLFHCDEEILEGEDGVLELVNIFPNLKTMKLSFLPNFKSLRTRRRALTMGSLEIIMVKECPRLKKLALRADHLKEIQGQTLWWNELEWEDYDIKMKFLPLFKESR